MRKLLLHLTLAAVLAGTVTPAAARWRFAHRRGRPQASAILEKNRKLQETATITAATKASSAIIDEWSEVDDGVKYRYVFGYNSSKERSSETIYKSTRDADGDWGSETLLTIGTYTYEYNSAGNIRKKSVTYTANDDFPSYYIEVAYGSDGLTSYKKYEYRSDKFMPALAWKTYASGKIAEYTEYEWDGEIDVQKGFDEQGRKVSWSDYYGTGYETINALNDRTIVKYDRYTSADSTVFRYVYDDATGRLKEFYQVGNDYSYDDNRYVFTYDSLGRLIRMEEQSTGDDEDSGASSGTDMAAMVPGYTVDDFQTTEYETYTYWNDEVYGLNNPWYAVFGFEGPLTQVTVNEDDGYYVNNTYFTRDANGLLTAVTVDDFVSEEEGVKETFEIVVNSNGHVTAVYNNIDEKGTAYSSAITNRDTTLYSWSNGVIIRETSKRHMTEGKSYSYNNSVTNFTYTDNGYSTITDETSSWTSVIDGETYSSSGSSKWFSSETSDGTTYEYIDGEYDSDGKRRVLTRLLHTIQQQDVSFVRPEVVNNYDGFSIDTVITVSEAGRVAVIEDEYSYNGTTGFTNQGRQRDRYYYVNKTGDDWYTVAKENGQTVCRDLEGRPVYVLEGEYLVAEYVYYDMASDNVASGGDSGDSSAETLGIHLATISGIPDGQAYEEVSYTYNHAGLLTGKSVTYVDSDGTTTGEVLAEYVYDPVSGIASANATAPVGAVINGRTLSIGSGTLTVMTTEGRVIASGVSQFTLPAKGIYVVTANGTTVKVMAR